MNFGVIVFPGSNCDHDCAYALSEVLGQRANLIWHEETCLGDVDAIIFPGGFSYGDYLRTGAIAQFSPIIKAVKNFADRGGIVLGICNGFQILLEVGLLPGAMLRNRDLSFVCEDIYVKVENAVAPFTSKCHQGQILKLPIAHAAGNYFVDSMTLKLLESKGQIVLRYCRADGKVTINENPNGSLNNIAAIKNETGNVMGLMPHPERCIESIFKSQDGDYILGSMVDSFLNSRPA